MRRHAFLLVEKATHSHVLFPVCLFWKRKKRMYNKEERKEAAERGIYTPEDQRLQDSL
jgi:hypothetical protein